jgi:predicted alpha/beta-fold hydrolase
LDTVNTIFEPPRFLGHRHVQSILPSWWPRERSIWAASRALRTASRPQILACDGARLMGLHASRSGPARGLVVLLHGWEGSADAHYILSTAAVLYEAGFDVFRLNLRDHGGTHALNPELFHSCRIDEVVGAVGAIERGYRRRGPLCLVGFSLGGNFALRVAVRAPQAGLRVARVLAVCPVLHPPSTMRSLEEGLWIYRHYFLRRWRRSLQLKAAAFPELYDFGDLARFPTLTATTDYFVREYTEFANLESYLAGYAITGDALKTLAVSARIIAAADDPVIPSADLARLAPSDALELSVFARGGHCGFIADYRLRGWLEAQILEDLKRLA